MKSNSDSKVIVKPVISYVKPYDDGRALFQNIFQYPL